MRPADDPDPVRNNRRRRSGAQQVARARAFAFLCDRHGTRLCARRRRGCVLRIAACRRAAKRMGAGGIRAGFRTARAVDVRSVRAAAAGVHPPAVGSGAAALSWRARRIGRRDGGALGGDRQSLRRGAPRRRASLHRADARRGARRGGAVRDGARHGRAARVGGRIRGGAAAEIRTFAQPRQVTSLASCCSRSPPGSSRRCS